MFKEQCHFPLRGDSLSIAGEIIDLELLQSQPIEKWNGDVSSCSGRQARRLENKGAGEQRWPEKDVKLRVGIPGK